MIFSEQKMSHCIEIFVVALSCLVFRVGGDSDRYSLTNNTRVFPSEHGFNRTETAAGCEITNNIINIGGNGKITNNIINDCSSTNNQEGGTTVTGTGGTTVPVTVRMGCFRDKGTRQLNSVHWVFSANSPAVCIAACRDAGHRYAGPEAGRWCFCGNELPPEAIPDINCNMKCNGVKTVSCGGWWALEVFDTYLHQNQNTARIGCYRDKGDRQLGQTHWVFPANSPAVCTAACRDAGYKYAGPEATSWCFCGNLLPPVKIPDINCNMKCNGEKSLSCGGWWALEIFETGV